MVTRRSKERQVDKVAGKKRKRSSEDSDTIPDTVQGSSSREKKQNVKRLKGSPSRTTVSKEVDVVKLRNKTRQSMESIRRHNDRAHIPEKESKPPSPRRRSSLRNSKRGLEEATGKRREPVNREESRVEEDEEDVVEETNLEHMVLVPASEDVEPVMEDEEIVEYEDFEEEEQIFESVGQQTLDGMIEEDDDRARNEGEIDEDEEESNGRTVSDTFHTFDHGEGNTDNSGTKKGRRGRVDGEENTSRLLSESDRSNNSSRGQRDMHARLASSRKGLAKNVKETPCNGNGMSQMRRRNRAEIDSIGSDCHAGEIERRVGSIEDGDVLERDDRDEMDNSRHQRTGRRNNDCIEETRARNIDVGQVKGSLSNGDRRKSTSDINSTVGRGRSSEAKFNEMRNHINMLKARLKKTLDEKQDLKNNNASIKLQMIELNKQVVELKIELASLRNLKPQSNVEKKLKPGTYSVKTDVKFVRNKSGRRIYTNNVDEKYRSITDRLKEEVKYFASLEVVEMKVSYKERDGVISKNIYYNWEGRVDYTDGEEGSGMIDSLENISPDEYGFVVAQCPINAVVKHGMFTPSMKKVEERISQMLHSIIAEDIGVAIREGNQVTNCVEQISNDRAILADYRMRIGNAIGSKKKAAKNRFTSLLGYSMLNTRISRNAEMSQAEKDEMKRQYKEFEEKVSSHTKKDNNEIDFSWWRCINAYELSYSEVSRQYETQDMNVNDRLFQNQIARSVYNEYVGQHIINRSEVENTIASLARVDVWIYLVAKFSTEEREKGKSLQMKYSETQNRYLPLAVQQILMNIRREVAITHPSELTLRMNCSTIGGDSFNNELRNVTKVVVLKSISKCYVVVDPVWFVENVSKYMGRVLDCYIGMFDLHLKEDGKEDEMSEEITLSCSYN